MSMKSPMSDLQKRKELPKFEYWNIKFRFRVIERRFISIMSEWNDSVNQLPVIRVGIRGDVRQEKPSQRLIKLSQSSKDHLGSQIQGIQARKRLNAVCLFYTPPLGPFVEHPTMIAERARHFVIYQFQNLISVVP